MKTLETQLKIQAYLDGELPPAETRQVEGLLATDQQGRQLLEELRFTSTALRENEPAAKLPVSGDFFWSQVQRGIAAAESRETTPDPIPWLAMLRRMFLPVSGLALVALLAIGIATLTGEDPERHFVQVENLSEEMDTTTFRYQSEKMFVVWVSPKEPEVTSDFQIFEDTLFQ